MGILGTAKMGSSTSGARPTDVGSEVYFDAVGNRLSAAAFYELDLQAKVVFADATYTYVSKAAAGADPAVAVWQVSRTKTDGSTEEGTRDWADGDTKFDNLAIVDAADVSAETFS